MRFGKRVRRGTFCFGLTMLAGAGAAMMSAGSPPVSATQGKLDRSELIVHEWGTFLGMSGSDGLSLDGMYHEEHALPAFVHSRSRDQLRLPAVDLKGETPVIYFYSKVRQQVRVRVDFPRGVWTQWYPQVSGVNPPLIRDAEAPDHPRGGRIYWQAEVIPLSVAGREVKMPATSSDALWNHAREVDAAYVKTIDGTNGAASPEFEKFLFYRGLGEARLPLQLDSRQNGTLTLDRETTLGKEVRQVFVIRVENGRGAYRFRPALRPGQQVSDVIPSMAQSLPLAEFTKAVAADLAARLTESGLYEKEAQAMVSTWTTSYFQTDGVRAIFVMPQSWTDAFIPMRVLPEPKQIVRVMVGRLELLTAEREKLAATAVRDLASVESSKRQQAFRFLHEQGRYVEPIVRRVLKTTNDDSVRGLCRRLLLTELVTDLRAAVNNSADGKKLTVDPVLLRAHLARLLREIGSDQQARTEGEAVLAALKTYPRAPNQTSADNPAALEIRAAAVEATGDDRKASAIYAHRVDLQLKSIAGNFGPDSVTWLRDWWVGRAYARCLLRTPKAALTIAELEKHLVDPSSRSGARADEPFSRVFLALLLDAQGKAKLADAQWSELTAQPKLEAAQGLPTTSAKVAGQTGT
jgi:hypothetical protein